MVELWHRTVSHTVRVKGEDVSLIIQEEYTSDSPAVPVRARVLGPQGLVTEGPPVAAWHQMLKKLGLEPPAPPVIEAPRLPADAQCASPPQSACEISRSLVLPETQHTTAELGSPAAMDKVQPKRWESAISKEETSMNKAQRQQEEMDLEAEEHDEEEQREEEEEEDEGEEDEGEEDEGEESPIVSTNPLQESLLRLLNQRRFSDDPPPEITPDMAASISQLSCTQDAADVMKGLNENIRLTAMQGDAARRAEKLFYLKKANRAKRCSHVKFNGENCGSPALRSKQFCHFHLEAHTPSIDIPVIEDLHSLQVAFTRLAQQVAANKIDAGQARVLLQILQSAGRSLPDNEGRELASPQIRWDIPSDS